jgi:hypothetical protein
MKEEEEEEEEEATGVLLLALTSGRAGQSHGPRNAQVYFLVSIIET